MGSFNDLGDTFTERCSVFKYKVEQSSPEILLGLGIISLLGAVVSSAIAGRKNDEILEDHLNRVEEAKVEVIVTEDGTEVVRTKKEVNSLVRREYMKTGWMFTRNYALSGLLTACSITCFVAMHNIQAGWFNALSVAYTGLQETFRRYQKNNIELNGIENHQMCKYGYKEIKEVDENGDVTVKKVPKTVEEVAADMGYNPDAYQEVYFLNKDNCGILCGTPAVDLLALQKAEEEVRRRAIRYGYITLGQIKDVFGVKDEASTVDLIFGIPKGLENEFSSNYTSPANNKTLAGYPNEDIVIEFTGLINLHEYFRRKDAAQYLLSKEVNK